MSDEKKYQGKPRGGAGLGQGKKKTKEFVKKNFALDIHVSDILAEYGQEKGFAKGTIVEFVELAILELNMQLQAQLVVPGIADIYFDFQNRKDKLFAKVAAHHDKISEQFL